MKKTIVMSDKRIEKLVDGLGFAERYGKLFVPRKLYEAEFSNFDCHRIISIFIDKDTSVLTFKCNLSGVKTERLRSLVTEKIYDALGFHTEYSRHDFTDSRSFSSCTLYYDDVVDADDDTEGTAEKLEELRKKEEDRKREKEAEKAEQAKMIKTRIPYADYKKYLWSDSRVMLEENSYDADTKTVVVLWDRDAAEYIEQYKAERQEAFESDMYKKVKIPYGEYKNFRYIRDYDAVPDSYDPRDKTIMVYELNIPYPTWKKSSLEM